MTDTVYKFGPPRTGGTLVMNLMKEIFPTSKVHITHHWDKSLRERVVVTYRDPRDIICSSVRIQEIKLRNWKDGFRVKLKKPLDDFLYLWNNYKNSPDVLFLCYEKFYNNFDYIFDNLERFYSISIPKERRNELKEKYHVKKMKKIADRLKTFTSPIDLENMIHGKHISPKLGEPGQWETYIPPQYHAEMEEVLWPYMKALGYKRHIGSDKTHVGTQKSFPKLSGKGRK